MTALAEFHDELRTVARALLAPTSPLVTGGEPAAADWAQLAQAGWLGLDVPEEHGGAGASFAEVAVVLEELGRAATASPVLGAVLAVGALGLVDPSPRRDELLAGIAAGDVTAAVALPTGDLDGGPGALPTGDLDGGSGALPTGDLDGGSGALPTGDLDGGSGALPADVLDGAARALPFRLERAGGADRLVGRAPFVPDASGAARLLVVASDPSSGPVLVEVAPGEVEVRPTPVVDVTRSLGEVVADGTPVDGDRCWPLTGDPHDLYLRGAVAVALDSLGIAQAALDATVAYAADRHQFGRPIGSFQAVKHACADVAVELAVSRRLVTDAVDRLVAGAPDAGVAVAMAKAHAVETGVAATGSALQLHGGIGYTWEHGLHVLLKRATLNRSLFGSPAAHRARLAQRYEATAPG
jgi:alkylation response protein AidB-like acyl-CoA dehydrogenase